MKDDYISRLLASVRLPGIALKELEQLPAADVQPVRHGRLLNPNPYGECSLCGYLIDIRDSYNYCPNCGAKMDGGKT